MLIGNERSETESGDSDLFDQHLDVQVEDVGAEVEEDEPLGPPRLRGRCVEDRMDHIPEGCYMRKYHKEGEDPYWQAGLRPGVVDADGHCSRRRKWGRGGITEMDVLTAMDEWLWDNCGN